MNGKLCTSCHQLRSSECFYKKGQRLESRCKPCVLAAKAAAYRKVHLRPRSKTVEWKEVFETISDEAPATDLKVLLRDFMMEVILDTDPRLVASKSRAESERGA